MIKFIKISLIFIFLTSMYGCGGISKTDARKTPSNAQERARQNVEQGKGMSIGNIMKSRKGGNFEFSSSNPMWRATLEILDFIPMTTVDYSGGMIISDWYSDNNDSNESIKITVRFLSNEIRSESLKIIVHQKKCSSTQNCNITLLGNSKIDEQLRASILKKAVSLKTESENKKR